jgi:hypothetical protein
VDPKIGRRVASAPARRRAAARFRREDAAMTIATIAAEPDRHALVMPDCECGMCAPTWARRRGKSRRFTQPVTLVAALEKESPAARPAMVEEHRARLEAMVCAADRLIGATTRDDPGRTGPGLALVLFAGELASAARPDEFRGQLPAGLVAACEQTVTAATLAAAGCLVGIVEAVQALSMLVG